MDRKFSDAEVMELFQQMDLEMRAWALEYLRELAADVRADQILQEALGPEYEPLDVSAWRPSTLPPDCATWAEYEARLDAGRGWSCPPPGV